MAENVLDSLFHKIKATVGLCTPNVKQLKEYLEKAKQYTEKAQKTTKFIEVSPGMPDQLRQASKAINGVLQGIDKIDSHVGNIGAACEISDALSVLNKWAADPQGDNAKAAAAFDKLFGALSVYASKLPPPVNQYGKILSQISVCQFFSNMQKLGDSRVGNNTSTVTGKNMKAINDELEHQAGR